MIGERFGRWTILEEGGERVYPRPGGGASHRHRLWRCVCDCGNYGNPSEASLRRGQSQSCGCLTRERSSEKHLRHGLTGTSEYASWQAMLSRCRNPNNPRWNHYGGRGISVCPEWEGFETFLEDMGSRPSLEHSLDRRDNDKGYSPENCRWATSHEQMTNRGCTRFVEFDGESVPLATLAKRHGLPANTLRARIVKGWDVQVALTTPVRDKRAHGTGSKRSLG